MWKQSFCNCLIALIASNVCAENFRIDPTSNLKPHLSRIHAGDTIVLTNGIWSDIDLRFEELPGTLNQPIHIRAESVGKVVMTGAVKFRVSGTHVVISGLRFSDPSEVSDVFELRTHSQRHAHKCRVTDCWFEQTKDTGKFESRWLNVYGTGNRIDHCYFEGKRTQGPTLVVWVADETEKHRLDHNHFGPRPKLGKNGGETIRVGTSDTSEFDCSTIVEENFFDRCNGEGEIISNKSCGNVYRHNLFERCEGALTLRHGHRCIVDSNRFMGHKVSGTGGIRVIGSQHVVTNNYFEGLRGDAERAGICFMNGVPNSPLNGYARVRNAVVAHNTFIDCKVSMEFGVGDDENSEVATNCLISHNVFVPTKWELFRVRHRPVNVTWKHNKYQSGITRGAEIGEFERVNIDFVRASDGLLRPPTIEALQVTESCKVGTDIDGKTRHALIAGCDDPTNKMVLRNFRESSGPTWHRE